MDKTTDMKNNPNSEMEVNFEAALENYLNEDFGDLDDLVLGRSFRIGKFGHHALAVAGVDLGRAGCRLG